MDRGLGVGKRRGQVPNVGFVEARRYGGGEKGYKEDTTKSRMPTVALTAQVRRKEEGRPKMFL